MRTFVEDLRFGLRVLRAHPGFAAVAVLTLALGIASTTTVFSWIDGALLRPYPGASDAARLAALEDINANAPNGGTEMSWLEYRDYRDHLKSVSGVAAHRQNAFTLGDEDHARLVWGQLVSPNYFDVLGIRAWKGRLFTGGESSDSEGTNRVVVISERLWRSQFRGDPGVVGKAVRINRCSLTIVGITPDRFRGTAPAMIYDLWVPFTMAAELSTVDRDVFRNHGNRNLKAIVRLKPGVTVEQARAEARTVAASLAAWYPKTNRDVSATVLPTWREHNGVADALFQPLRILMALSVVVLIIVCANVANLLLARSLARQREFGIRVALGASRVRIMRQLLTETLLLALMGGFFAIPLLLWMQSSLPSLVPSVGLPLVLNYELSARVLGFTLFSCLLAVLISGTAPALFAMRPDVNESLKEGGRAGSPTVASGRTRAVLVVAEVALASVALIGAGLFARSFRNASAIHPGFDSSQVLFGRFFIESAAYTGEQIQQFSIRLRSKLESMPGIRAAAYSDFVPLSTTGGPYSRVQPDGYVPAQGESMSVNRTTVSPGYFGVMGVPLLEGREFTAQDDEKSVPAMIVNQTFARRYFRGDNPVGRNVRLFGRTFRVIGMARDCKYFHPAESPIPHFYLAFRQFYGKSPELYFLVRTAGAPEQAIATLRRAVAEVDSNASAFHAVPLSEYTQVALIGQKIAAAMMGAMGLIAMALAALGLYSVMSYSVRQRAQEIGIRMAMGARPGQVVVMILRQGMRMALAGLLVGMLLSMVVSRFVASFLIHVDSIDPLTFVSASAFLAAVAALAIWVPARRATHIDPITALRQ